MQQSFSLKSIIYMKISTVTSLLIDLQLKTKYFSLLEIQCNSIFFNHQLPRIMIYLLFQKSFSKLDCLFKREGLKDALKGKP